MTFYITSIITQEQEHFIPEHKTLSTKHLRNLCYWSYYSIFSFTGKKLYIISLKNNTDNLHIKCVPFYFTYSCNK